MNNTFTSVPMDQNIKSNQPTTAQPPSLDLPTPLPPNLHLPNWLLAILLVTVLTERLRQLILVLIYFLHKLRQNKEV